MLKRFNTNSYLIAGVVFVLAFWLVVFFSLITEQTEGGLVGHLNGATLKISPEVNDFNVGDSFSASVYVNTNNENVVVASAHIDYDNNAFEAVSIDVSGSEFVMSAESVILKEQGFVKIVRGIPTPGVRGGEVLLARINFKAIAPTCATSDNLKFRFVPNGASGSNVLIDDGKGTNRLTGVYNASYNVSCDAEVLPLSPVNVKAESVSQNQINLSWSAPVGGKTPVEYRVERCRGAECSDFVLVSSISATAFSDFNLLPETVYRYRLSSVYEEGVTSFYSDIVEASTGSSSPLDADIPTNLRVSVVSSSVVRLSWNASLGAESYVILRCVGSGCSDFEYLSITPSTDHSDTNLSSNTVYRYKVGAVGIAGNMPDVYSNIAQIMIEDVSEEETEDSEKTEIDEEFEFTKILKKGMTDYDVGRLQRLLAQDGDIYPEGSVNNHYGDLTEKAVERFQCRLDIVCGGTPETTGYGMVDLKTIEKLNEIQKTGFLKEDIKESYEKNEQEKKEIKESERREDIKPKVEPEKITKKRSPEEIRQHTYMIQEGVVKAVRFLGAIHFIGGF